MRFDHRCSTSDCTTFSRIATTTMMPIGIRVSLRASKYATHSSHMESEACELGSAVNAIVVFIGM